MNPVNEVSVTTPLNAATIAIETRAMIKAYSTTCAPVSFRTKPTKARRNVSTSDRMKTPLNSDQTHNAESERATVSQGKLLASEPHRSHVLKVLGSLSRNDETAQVKRS